MIPLLPTIVHETVNVLKTAWDWTHIPLALYALWAITYELREKVADWMGKRHGQHHRMKWTSIKDVIRKDHTERIKLRLLRVNKDTEILSIDPAPVRDPNRTPVDVSNLYSIPGSASIDAVGKINILFADKLEPYRDHVVLVGYTMNETIEALHQPPGVWAVQPVGKYLIYEAHFPPGQRYERSADDPDKPKIVVRTAERELRYPGEYRVDGGCFDFDDGLGQVDWLKVTIPKPPQKHDVHIDWYWESAQSK
jgi:hypothetical protein